MRFNREVLPYVRQIETPRLFRVLRNDGVGRRIPILLPVTDGKIFSPGRYLRALAIAKAWGVARMPNGHIFIPALNFETTNFLFFSLLADEWHGWERWYLPMSVRGKTVLDAGAACGDTAMFFIYNGAKKVISIEPDRERFVVLKRNIEANNWNAEAINDVLRPEHLRMDFDFAKIDIETSDMELLKLNSLPPCVVETHWEEVTDAFVRKFGMRKLRRNGPWNILTNV